MPQADIFLVQKRTSMEFNVPLKIVVIYDRIAFKLSKVSE